MSRLLLTLLAILAIFSASASSKSRCPPNEEWADCATACPLTCKEPNPRPCTLQCVPSCKCINGLLRNDANKCVPRSKC